MNPALNSVVPAMFAGFEIVTGSHSDDDGSHRIGDYWIINHT